MRRTRIGSGSRFLTLPLGCRADRSFPESSGTSWQPLRVDAHGRDAVRIDRSRPGASTDRDSPRPRRARFISTRDQRVANRIFGHRCVTRAAKQRDADPSGRRPNARSPAPTSEIARADSTTVTVAIAGCTTSSNAPDRHVVFSRFAVQGVGNFKPEARLTLRAAPASSTRYVASVGMPRLISRTYPNLIPAPMIGRMGVYHDASRRAQLLVFAAALADRCGLLELRHLRGCSTSFKTLGITDACRDQYLSRRGRSGARPNGKRNLSRVTPKSEKVRS